MSELFKAPCKWSISGTTREQIKTIIWLLGFEEFHLRFVPLVPERLQWAQGWRVENETSACENGPKSDILLD